MFTKASASFSVYLQTKLRLLFVVFFVSGIFAGVFLSFRTGEHFIDLIDAATNGAVTVWSLAVVLLIPLLVSFFVFYFNIPILILPIGFLKAAIYGFCSGCILLAYGSAGWLVRFLLLFSDSTMIVVLCWYWLRRLDIGRFRLKQDTVLCFGLASMIGLIDYMYISPFLAILLQR